MTSRRNFKHTNSHSSDALLAPAECNISQIDLETSNENQRLNHRMDTLEKLVNNRLDQENIQIKQLQDKIKKLEEQAIQHETQIKLLEDKAMSSSVKCGNYVFTRWMNSRHGELSLWSNENYCKPLLSYIGKIYGQKHNIRRLLGPLRIESNNSDELDQLYAVIKKFEGQPGAKKSLREWRLQTRSNHRLEELKAIFEFDNMDPLSLSDWKITPSNLKEIISRESINAYFDFICRDGFVTAEIGEYLHLNKENIFGGNDYDSHNERVTLVNVDLSQSIINLDDSRVDLITCFVTLHHVPQLKPILSELVRILRPGGYLILREHDCKKARTLLAKYLNFVHAFMMIARVGEFSHVCSNHINQTQDESDDDSESDTTDWEQQKSDIIKYTSSIQYRTRCEWQKELESVGFRLKATFQYDLPNPQELYYAIYQLHTK